MKLEQRQENGKQFLACELLNEGGENFEERILLGLKLPHVLPGHLEYEEMKRQWIYDMTGLIPITNAWENRKLTADAMSAAILQICRTAELLETHMLRQENLLLAPEWVMTAQESENELSIGDGQTERQVETEAMPNLYFCIVPGGVESFQSDAGKLLRFLLQKTDTEREEALRLGFSMFQLSLCPEIRLEQWSRKLLTERKKLTWKQRVYRQAEGSSALADRCEEAVKNAPSDVYTSIENNLKRNVPIKNKMLKSHELQEKALKDNLLRTDHLKSELRRSDLPEKMRQDDPLLLLQGRTGMRKWEEDGSGENLEQQRNMKKFFWHDKDIKANSRDITVKQKKKVWKKKGQVAQNRAEDEAKVSEMEKNEVQEQASESETENSPFLKAAVSIGILTAAFLAVWILRGRAAAMRFLLPYLILCVSMMAFFALEAYRKN